jgi:hypothetical protein
MRHLPKTLSHSRAGGNPTHDGDILSNGDGVFLCRSWVPACEGTTRNNGSGKMCVNLLINPFSKNAVAPAYAGTTGKLVGGDKP